MIIGRYRITKRGYVVFGAFGVIIVLVLVMLLRSLVGSFGAPEGEGKAPIDQQQTNEQSSSTAGNTGNTDSTESQSLSVEAKNKILASGKQIIYFKPDLYDLNTDYYPKLDEVVNLSKRFKDARIVIDGHYNGYPDFKVTEFFTSLAQNRAEMVEAYLISQGVAQERITIVNKGCSEPVNKDGTWQEIEKNRRVEVYFEPLK